MVQSETALPAKQLNVSSQGVSSTPASLVFGDAMVKATTAVARTAPGAPTQLHGVKKPADKKTDEPAIAGSKDEQATPAASVQVPQPTPAKTPTLLIPSTGSVPMDGASSSDDVVEPSKGNSDKALSGLSQPASGDEATPVTIAPASQKGTNVVAPNFPSTADNLPPALHQPASVQPAAKGDAVQRQNPHEQVDSSSNVPAPGSTDDGNPAAGKDAPAVATGASPNNDTDPSLMLGLAPPTPPTPPTLPALPTAVLDAGVSTYTLNESDSTAGAALKPGASSGSADVQSKNVAAGGSSAGAKPKSANSVANSAAPSTASSVQKAADPVQSPPSVAAGASPSAHELAAQTNGELGAAGVGSSHLDTKGAQHDPGNAVADSIPTASPAGTDQSWDASATQVVHRAQLIQAMHQSEMRMGMNSAEFGNISISAAVNHQMLSAQISLDHADLSRALTAHLPEIEKNLGNAYGLQSRVQVRDSSSSPQQGSSRRDGERPQEGVRGIPNGSSSGVAAASVARDAASTTVYSPVAGMRLDILI